MSSLSSVVVGGLASEAERRVVCIKRIGHVKYMWPKDLKQIFDRLDFLNCDAGFACETRPYIYQDFDSTKSPVKATDYYATGLVVDHMYASRVSKIFYHSDRNLVSFDTIKNAWELLDSEKSVVFVDTYETQRETWKSISYKTSKIYKLAVGLMLASPHGQPLITSSFEPLSDEHPPYTMKNGIPVATNQRPACASGWICEHRRTYIARMIKFRQVVGDAPITNWYHNGRYRFGFCRSKRGFILINNDPKSILNEKFKTDLPAGIYCDVITGVIEDGQCTSAAVKVDAEGYAHVTLLKSSDTGGGLLAIHVDARES